MQVPDALPHHLPTIAFWNSSSLCAVDVSVARARLEHLKGLLRKADVVIVCEVHPREDWVEDLDLRGYASWISKEASNPGGAGGVLVVMSSRFAKQHRALVIPIWSGRMVQIRLEMGVCTLNIIGAHMTPIPPLASWEHLACALHGHIATLNPSDPLIMIGDLNFL